VTSFCATPNMSACVRSAYDDGVRAREERATHRPSAKLAADLHLGRKRDNGDTDACAHPRGERALDVARVNAGKRDACAGRWLRRT
jgi:hypothetical protein